MTTEPTETESGVESRSCDRCGVTESRPLSPIPHVHDLTWVEEVPASCTEPGSTGYFICSGCGLLYADQDGTEEIDLEDTIIPATGHSWGEWTMTVEPTGTETGVESRTCDRCGETESRLLPPVLVFHALTKVEAVPATCEEPGHIGYYSCSGCGQMFTDENGTQRISVKDTIIPAPGHSWSEWTVTTEPTETEPGVESRTCDRCGETETRTSSRLPHNCPSRHFTDVDLTAWYHEDLDFAVSHGLMTGVAETLFAPDSPLTRAMVVTVLHRLEGAPAAEKSAFLDVEAGSWYEDAVNWAAANGITNGVSETEFAPDAKITREQMAVFLYRYAQYKGYDVTATASLEQYTDASQVSDWAVEGMIWAKENHIVYGIAEDELAPLGTATRIQFAAMLHRYCVNILVNKA